jgi:hypothetical protein
MKCVNRTKRAPAVPVAGDLPSPGAARHPLPLGLRLIAFVPARVFSPRPHQRERGGGEGKRHFNSAGHRGFRSAPPERRGEAAR